METVEFNLPGMTCETCAGKIRKALNESGVNQVDFDFKSRNVNITFDNNAMNKETVRSIIKGAGYEVI